MFKNITKIEYSEQYKIVIIINKKLFIIIYILIKFINYTRRLLYLIF